MQAKDIERHLAQLGQELTDRGVQKPIRVLMIGGAYMLLLAKMQRSTDDVDILWLDEEDAFNEELTRFGKACKLSPKSSNWNLIGSTT
jgi:predicted nucleotidyltransferase